MNPTDIKISGKTMTVVANNSGTEGNALVTLYASEALAKADNGSGTNVLWSWHIWVTNYNPNERIDGVANTNGKDIAWARNQRYGVVGNGELHTYGAEFEKVVTKTGYSKIGKSMIMDRSLGAKSAYNGGALPGASFDARNAHGMYYQCGRKDPLLRLATPSGSEIGGTYAAYYGYINGNSTRTRLLAPQDIINGATMSVSTKSLFKNFSLIYFELFLGCFFVWF